MATIGFVMFAPVKSSARRFCRQNGGEVNACLMSGGQIAAQVAPRLSGAR
ncbi:MULTISPECIES: hypothetical protein [Rhizobium]|nr:MULTISPECIES: hypothetical protein [Rhizobium]MBX4891562.1 hypothetical protein [Rhizobium bangladeshense]MBX4895815.1 hypothetical protein [Rhizobium bangladeshense]MBX4904146.1 hypothetical protein [Rhizobium bangladeshense]MBX4916141.1 hypothetical protein [Rhizobium bangladeshense]MBY3598966.1 hypothetical protein [Rhizobium bangladeshense]